MKIKLITLTTLLLLSGMALAQRGTPMYEDLDLTEAQKTQMQNLHADHKERMQTAREAVMAKTKTKMAEFLNEEQMQTVTERMENRQQRMHKGKNKMQQKRQHRKTKMNEEIGSESSKDSQ